MIGGSREGYEEELWRENLESRDGVEGLDHSDPSWHHGGKVLSLALLPFPTPPPPVGAGVGLGAGSDIGCLKQRGIWSMMLASIV